MKFSTALSSIKRIGLHIGLRPFTGSAARAEAVSLPRFIAPLCIEKSGKTPLTVVLDLDGTLVKTYEVEDLSSYPVQKKKPDFSSELFFGMGDITSYHTYERPGVRKFLQELREMENIEVVVYTLGLQPYVDDVLNFLDGKPGQGIIKHRLYWQHAVPCSLTQRQKDLRVLNRDLSRVISIDDSVYSYLRQPDNAVPIPPFLGPGSRTNTIEENVMMYALDTLKEALEHDDVRHFLKAKFGLRKALKSDDRFRAHVRDEESMNSMLNEQKGNSHR